MKFVPMEPILIYTVSGGNMLAVEPVRDRTELIGRLHATPMVELKELVKFLESHFEKIGESRAV